MGDFSLIHVQPEFQTAFEHTPTLLPDGLCMYFGTFERSPRKVIALITRLKAKLPVHVLCHFFGIHHSVYYAQVKDPVNVQRIALRSRVRALHALSRGAAALKKTSSGR